MMLLRDLVPDSPPHMADRQVAGFAIDSRQVGQGDIFGAFPGVQVNGEDFIDRAVAAGAIAVVARPEATVSEGFHIADPEPRRRFARLAARFFKPVPENVVAVTGTNGKTSVAELTRQLWQLSGRASASIGTLGITTADAQHSTGMTTPDIVTFLTNMTDLARDGVTHAVFEASSHGLAQYRTEGLPVRAAAFTNLSRDHLDYHGDMDSYFAAKLRLFTEVVDDDGTAVVWADDGQWSVAVIEAAKAHGLNIISVGRAGETIRLIDRQATAKGQVLCVEYDGKSHDLALPLIGAYQAANALCALGLALATGGEWDALCDAVTQLQPVRGRLELATQTFAGAPVYVDYAHTPDGLAAAINALRPHATGRIITVFGAGGDRDTGKRPEMGQVATELSDLVIVTDDNPRSEDPASIRRAILDAAPDAREIPDRRAAINEALSLAQAGDIVLLAGKGHEQGQVVGDRTLPFDDVTVARECAA